MIQTAQLVFLLATAGVIVAYFFKPAGPTEGFIDEPELQNINAPAEDDPRDLPWIASWSAADKAARAGQNCQPHYTEAGPTGTTIVTTSKSCEAGMPHTLSGDRIIIPDNNEIALRQTTIEHELIHIYQRRYPKEWATFYARQWSFQFKKAPPKGMPPATVNARRGNPDTWENPWTCWMGRFWPVPVYLNPQTPRLRDARTVWWDDWKQEILQEPPADWIAFFGRPSQEEHPHELAAVMLVDEDTTSEAGRRLMRWWQTKGRTMVSQKPQEMA